MVVDATVRPPIRTHPRVILSHLTISPPQATGESERAARLRLAAAGYDVPASTPLSSVHCEKGRFGWLGCGFLQCYATVDGAHCRILDYAPHQALQPHCHDADELFKIKGGRIKVFKWESEEALLSGAAPSSAEWLEAGGELSIPAGVCHCIYTDVGVAFHEVVGDFQKRSTKFLYAGEGTVGRTVCGADGVLRCVSREACNAFEGKIVAVTGCSRGLGLEFVHQLVAAGARVAATCRSPDRAPDLIAAVAHSPMDSAVLRLDVDDEVSIGACATTLTESLGGLPLDLLINNAGISTPNQ